jgi:predicted RNA-binding protein with PUA-like domain
MAAKWLAKSEPSVYSIDDLKRDKKTLWTGVRNFQARNFLRDGWQKDDLVLFYHSNAEETGIAGIARVVKSKVADPSQFDPKSDYFDPKSKEEAPTWYAPEVTFVKKFNRVVLLSDLKAEKKLSEMGVLKRGNRLSVQPVTDVEFKKILEMAEVEL